jgi:hypothetical protein
MSIIERLVQSYRNYKLNKQIEKWYSTIADEKLRQSADDQLLPEEYYQQMEALESERMKHFDCYEDLSDKYPYEDSCRDCGHIGSRCTCTSDEDDYKLEVPQMGLPGPEEEEIPLWLEHANERCSICGHLPEFCQCQYEDEE